jgi:amidase
MAYDLAFLDATAQAELVRRGDVSPTELVESAIQRIEKLNPKLNAVIHPTFDKARAVARKPVDGPFRGVPFLVKDLMCGMEGDPLHMGTRFLRDLGLCMPHDSYLGAKFRAAGFIVLGRTNTPELGTLPTTEPDAYGPTRNPWDLNRSPGGSSGGSAAAVAAGLVPAAHGNDGGGSIRIPASACGLVGLKTSRGRTSFGPDFGEGVGGLAAEGVMTHTVRDTAAILDLIAGGMPGDPYTAPPPVRPYREEVGAAPGRLRIGLLTRAPGGLSVVHPDCVAAAENAGRTLESLGHVVEVAHPAALDEPEGTELLIAMFATHMAHGADVLSMFVGRDLGPADFDPLNWALIEMGRSRSASQYLGSVDAIHAYTRRLTSWWSDGFDLLLTPTLGEPPVPIGWLAPVADDPYRSLMRAGSFAAFTPPFNLSGQPGISLPLHVGTDGLPIGVQLVAAYGREDLLIRIAAQLEQARPWVDRRPPVHA